MSEPDETQRGVATGIVAELEAEGFYGAEPVGRGGFGVVYRCRQPSLDRVVAIKVLNTDSEDVDLESFEREQRAMGRASGHPNIVPVLHSGLTFTGRPFIVMPYLGRNTLSAWIRQHGPLAVGEALTVGVRLAGALETAHRAPDGVTQPRGKLACVRNGRVGGSSARAARIRVVGRSATD